MSNVTSVEWNNLYKELVQFVSLKVKDKAVAEDIVHDVFIKVHHKSHQIRDNEKITAWIFQITRHAIADHFRNTSRNLTAIPQGSEHEAQEFNDCVAYCLRQLMQTLPEKYRLPLELTELKNHSQLEVATLLGMTYPAARSRVQRARKLLKAKLDNLYIIKTDPYGNVILCESRLPCCCRPSSEGCIIS
jgi:RNA polymerase sigma-70 factor, ECF subfamily